MKNVFAVLLLWIKIYYKGQTLPKYFDGMENPNLAKHLCMCIVLSDLLVQMRLLYLKSLKIMEKSIV